MVKASWELLLVLSCDGVWHEQRMDTGEDLHSFAITELTIVLFAF